MGHGRESARPPHFASKNEREERGNPISTLRSSRSIPRIPGVLSLHGSRAKAGLSDITKKLGGKASQIVHDMRTISLPQNARADRGQLGENSLP